MNRRNVLQSISLGLGGAVALPGWANAWTPSGLKEGILLMKSEEELLTDLSETIIPETDTPGARKLEISKFIRLMVSDLYEKKDQDRFRKALDKVEEISKLIYGKSYGECTKDQKLHLLQGLEMSSDADQKWFFNTVKRLTVQGYTTSEFYLTEIAKFEFAPGRFLGCVPLPKEN